MTVDEQDFARPEVLTRSVSERLTPGWSAIQPLADEYWKAGVGISDSNPPLRVREDRFHYADWNCKTTLGEGSPSRSPFLVIDLQRMEYWTRRTERNLNLILDNIIQ